MKICESRCTSEPLFIASFAIRTAIGAWATERDESKMPIVPSPWKYMSDKRTRDNLNTYLKVNNYFTHEDQFTHCEEENNPDHVIMTS